MGCHCIAAIKVIPDWFVSSKMIEKLDNALHANDDRLFHNEDFDKITFIACRCKFKNRKAHKKR